MAETIIKNTGKNIQQELNLLRSFLIGIAGKDDEGNYRPEFVKKLLRIAKEKEKFNFKDKKSFLFHIQQNK